MPTESTQGNALAQNCYNASCNIIWSVTSKSNVDVHVYQNILVTSAWPLIPASKKILENLENA